MSRKASIVESLRRMSKPEVLRRYSSIKLQGDNGQLKAETTEPGIGAKTEPREKSYQAPRVTLFSLPIELQIQIWNSLSCDDLCAARRASKAFKELLSEGDIPRQWMLMHFSAEQLAVNPIASPATFRCLLEQVTRARLLDNVSWQLVRYTKTGILLDRTDRQDQMSEENRTSLDLPLWHKLHASILSSLIILEHYFAQCRQTLISMPAHVPSHTNVEDEFKRLSWEVITNSYTTEQISSARSCYHFLNWLARMTLSRPSYVGRIERTMRGWLKDPVDFADFQQYLALTNIQAYAELLRVKTYKERRRVIETALRQFSPATSVHWRTKWWVTATRLDESISEQKAESALGVKLHAGMLWIDGAKEVLLGKGAILDDESDETGSPFQAMAFLNCIAGFNLLNGERLPPWTRESPFDHSHPRTEDDLRDYY